MPDNTTDEDVNAGELIEYTDSQGNRQFGLVLIRSTNEYEDGHTDEYAEVALFPTVALMKVGEVRKLNTTDKPDATKVSESSAAKATGILNPDRDRAALAAAVEARDKHIASQGKGANK